MLKSNNLTLLVRHAQSIGNLESNRINTQKDKRGLTAKGKIQTASLAKEISKVPLNFSKIVCSPLSRALETASIIGQLLSLPVSTDNRLLDIDRGVIDGVTYTEIRKSYPDVVKQWQTALPGEFAPPKGESFKQLIARAEGFLQSVNKEHAIIISHQDTIYAMLFTLLKIPLEYFFPVRSLFKIDNATATAVSISANQIFVPFVNRKNQLDKALTQSQTDREDLKLVVKRLTQSCTRRGVPSVVLPLSGTSKEFDSTNSLRDKTIARDVCTRAVGIGSYSYNNNYIVQTKKGAHLFVKFFQPKYLAKLQRELQILIYLKKKGFLVTSGAINQTQHQCYFVKPFLHRYSLQNWWRWGLAEKEKKRTLELVAEDLAHIHGLTPPIQDFWQFPCDTITNFADWCAFLDKKIAGDLKVIQDNKLLSAELLQRLKTSTQQEFSLYQQQPAEIVRLHGDSHLDNILLDKAKPPGMKSRTDPSLDGSSTGKVKGLTLKNRVEFIDFENARVGDGLWDLANMFKISFSHNSSNKYWQHFLSHYLRETKTRRTNVEYTLTFFCLLNFTGSLKTHIEKKDEETLKEEILLLKKFLYQ